MPFQWQSGLLSCLLGMVIESDESGMAQKHSEQEVATFAGGCFWCMEPVFDQLEGVLSATVGYTGGHTRNPTYEEVSSGQTGHTEAIQIIFDPHRVSYAHLVDIFWKNIDPTVPNRQFCDVGTQYRTAIFYHSQLQKKIAEKSQKEILNSRQIDRIHTEIVPAADFYPAEESHQKFYKKNPNRYKIYHDHCGRSERLKEIWDENR
jgi:peptide-methionine (S)-S-oxide reductase